MADSGNGSYYAVIPAEVRYDPELSASAKLLYGELTSLCNQTGYCWAGNVYFAELYGLSVRTVSRLIAQLEAKGYIRCETAATKDGSERHIYAGLFLVTQEGGRQKCPGGIDENVQTPLDKNVYQNNKQENNKQNIPPIAPQGGAACQPKKQSARRAAKTEPRYRPEWFERFWALYPRRTNRVAAVRAWDKLSPDLELCRVMTDALRAQMQTAQWREGPDHIPHPSTWLNGARWLDEVTPADSGGSQPPTPEVRNGWR